jgi:hypothetical protein
MLVDIIDSSSIPLSKLLRFHPAQTCINTNRELTRAVKNDTDSSAVHDQTSGNYGTVPIFMHPDDISFPPPVVECDDP